MIPSLLTHREASIPTVIHLPSHTGRLVYPPLYTVIHTGRLVYPPLYTPYIHREASIPTVVHP